MDGGITRQSDQYGIFDNTPRPERVAREAPQEVIREYTRGPSVGAGQLNPRNIRRHHFAEMTEQGPGVGAGLTYPAAGVAGTPANAALENGPGEAALESSMKADLASGGTYPGDPGTLDITGKRRQAVDTRGMDPRSHAYGGGEGDPLFGEFGHEGYDYEGVSRGEFNHRMRGRDPREESQMAREDIHDQDDESGYNWGPEPHHYTDEAYSGPPATPLQPLDQMLEHHRRPDPTEPSGYLGSRLGFNRRGQGLMTHMFAPGNRVGLPYNGSVINGIVHQIHPDSEVGVRWEDGQYSKESPGDIQPL